ncbi:MAG: efflux RND transporter periplasmic adaptor subunit [Desulfobacteraceae bacterium]|nr:efflux RND transporter periplasmic adaptor subunit [Desulfobacteraceae bacterium]MBC2755439.1 efflux RND transporter periplasmic adaptor subunit [Desulfobacteraceae bacterium]
MKILKIILPIFFICFLWSCGTEKEQAPFVPEVDVFEVTRQELSLTKDFVGQIYGLKDIAIRARVAGYLEEIHFKEGTRVNKNDLLYSIESQPFEETVAARMSDLAAANTHLAKAKSDLNRYRPLAAENAVSQSDLDAAQANYDASVAGVEAAEANLRAAQINLSYTQVKSPINGLIGQTKAKVGDFVGQSPNPVILNTVSQTDTILVRFFITENQYLTLSKKILTDINRVAEGKKKGSENFFQLILADGTFYDHKGTFDFIDRGIDPTTGAILIQASFPNPQALLRPGQFARIRAEVSNKAGIIIPQRCVMELQGQYTVYVVNDGNQIENRQVKLGPAYHNFFIVKDGLSEGDRIVYEGLQKVRPGADVKTEIKDIPLIKQEQ